MATSAARLECFEPSNATRMLLNISLLRFPCIARKLYASWRDAQANESTRSEDLAGAPGFEPGITGPKPVALPLGHAPMPAGSDGCEDMMRPDGWQPVPAHPAGAARGTPRASP